MSTPQRSNMNHEQLSFWDLGAVPLQTSQMDTNGSQFKQTSSLLYFALCELNLSLVSRPPLLLNKHRSLPVLNPESLQDHSSRSGGSSTSNSFPKGRFWANLHITAHVSRREAFFAQPLFCWLSIPCLPAIIAIKLSPLVLSACTWLPFLACLLFTVLKAMKLTRTTVGNPTGIAESSAMKHVKVQAFCWGVSTPTAIYRQPKGPCNM